MARRRIFAASKRALRRAWRDTENAQIRKKPEGNVGYVGTAIDNHPCLRVCPVISDQNCGRGCHPSHPRLAAEADLHRGAQSRSAKVPSADLSKCSTLREQSSDAIHDYLDRHNANPKPFMWTKSADVVLAKERRALEALEAVKSGYQLSDSQQSPASIG